MMIEITESKHGFLCQVCHEKEDVKQIDFHAEGTGVIVRLCKPCRGKLLGLLMSEVVRSIKDIGEYRIDGKELINAIQYAMNNNVRTEVKDNGSCV